MLALTEASSGLLSQTSNSRRWAAVTVGGCVAVRSSRPLRGRGEFAGLGYDVGDAAGRQLVKVVDVAGEDHFSRLAEPDEGWQQSRVDDRWHADLDLGQAE